MRQFAASLRQPALALVSLASLAGAGAALWFWAAPETIDTARTVWLVGILGLFVLPLATLASVELDRRTRPAASAMDATDPLPEALPVAAACATASHEDEEPIEANDIAGPRTARRPRRPATVSGARRAR